MQRLEKIYIDVPALKPGSLGAYAFAIGVTALAVTIRLAIEPYVTGVQYITFFPAVIITTLVCGVRAGFLSVALCAAAAYIFILSPQVNFGVPPTKEIVTLALFTLIASVDVGLIGALRFAIRNYRDLSRSLEQRVEARTKELVRTQENLVQAQKMEALGQLTGGMAHDFNNMLGVVIGNLDMAQRRLTAGEQNIARYLHNALEGAGRAATLIQRLLAFARRQPLRPQSIDVNKLVSSTSDLLHRTLGEAVKVECVLGAGLWRGRADPSQLEAAIVNLALNARDAMPNGGPLTLETCNVSLDEQYASRHADVLPGEYVMVAVTDTGRGMDQETLAKAMQPYFTTKATEGGTGLGLSQVHGFAKQSGGHLTLYSEVGSGTTAKLYLPRSKSTEDAPDQHSEVTIEDDEGRRRAVILLVEDDERVRDTTAEQLRDLGHEVIETSGGEEALRILQTDQHLDLLFTDVVMPIMNGRALAREALKLRPDLRVLYTTGYTANAILHNGTLDPSVLLLVKPFNLRDLHSALNKALRKVAEPS